MQSTSENIKDNNFSKEREEIINSLESYHKRWNSELVVNAFDFAVNAHRNQFRQSGEPYITHPIAVAKILIDLKTDYIAVAASLLHDVVEDASVSVEEIRDRFGDQVALLVDGVTKISGISFQSNLDRNVESIRKMLLSMLKDLRVILIKLADRLHNMRTINAKPPRRQHGIAMETREVFVPLAYRLGIAKVGRELEDLTLQVIDPEAYKEIKARIYSTQSRHKEIIEEIVDPINKELKALGIFADVLGRVKSISSIYNKIHRQNKEFSEIFDLLAVRIIVKNKPECYRILGIIHDTYTPVTDHFEDFIALPKSNLYQSLHTKVRDRKNRIIEIQIRTQEMHNIAEIGIAAHWRYKQGYLQPDSLDDHYSWIRSLMEAHKEEAETGEFLESLKINLFQDEIFVFTPKGKLIQLPRGATPLDFAFAIHTEVGLHTIGAKVKGKIIPLNYKLESGEVVQILTSPKQKPNVEWVSFVRTSRARSLIKRWFRDTRWEQSRSLGETIIMREVKPLKISDETRIIEDVAVLFGFTKLEEFYAAVGSGMISPDQVMRKLVPMVVPKKNALFSRLIQLLEPKKDKVKITGPSNLALSVADCCNPLPGDPITGVQKAGKGLEIHRTDCHKVAGMLHDESKMIGVAWDVEREDRFRTRIQVVADERENLLLDITRSTAAVGVNITKLEMHIEDNLVFGSLVAVVRSLPHLTKLIGKLNQINGIIIAERVDISSEQYVRRKED